LKQYHAVLKQYHAEMKRFRLELKHFFMELNQSLRVKTVVYKKILLEHATLALF